MAEAKTEVRYICLGTCQGNVSEEQFKKGMNKCEDKTCEGYQKPLARKLHCLKCEEYFDEGQNHDCEMDTMD